MNTPLIVFVHGGCVTGIFSEDGKEYPCAAVVDYDNEENCPVCGAELPEDESQPCPECGYDESKDNALECAVKLLKA